MQQVISSSMHFVPITVEFSHFNLGGIAATLGWGQHGIPGRKGEYPSELFPEFIVAEKFQPINKH